MISAAKAHAKTLCALNDNIRAPLQIVEEQIKLASTNGHFNTQFYQYPLAPEIISILRAYGYTVEVLNDYNIYISWDTNNGDDEL